AVYRWLTGPSRDRPAMVRLGPQEAFGGLRLWLALREPGFCDLYAVGEMADRGIVPCLAEWPGQWKLCSTCGVLGEAGLCVFARAADRSPPPEEDARGPAGAATPSSRVVIRSFGPDRTLLDSLASQVLAWDAAGRPDIDKLRIRAYSAE